MYGSISSNEENDASGEVDWFAGAPLGQLVYDRTYARIKDDGIKERWPETVRRVVDGNIAFVDSQFVEPNEREELFDLLLKRQLIPAGRHLWVTGVQDRAFTQNCHVAGFETGLSDHCAFVFSELMKGGGVGANYSSQYLSALTPLSNVEVRFCCDEQHADFEILQPLLGDNVSNAKQNEYYFRIPDSREGWVEALTTLLEAAAAQGHKGCQDSFTIVYDVSDIRPKGSLIRGFGGISSGPYPLMNLLLEVSNLTKESSSVTPDLVMEIDHLIASAVIAGNVRRSARMSIMHWNDPFIDWFLNCKADHMHHWSTNISVEIDNDFFRDLLDENSKASRIYMAVIEGMLTNGEPGFYNASLASQGERGHLGATNPCVSPDTWTLTDKGPRKVGELVGTPTTLAVDGDMIPCKSDGFYQTGVKETVKVSFKHWKTPLICTPNQKLNTPNGWTEVENLRPGDKLRIQDHQGITWEGPGTEDEGYLLGHFIGDGTFAEKSGRLCIWDADGDTLKIRSELERIIRTRKVRSDFKGWYKHPKGWWMDTKTMADLANEYGIFGTDTKTVNETIERASSDFCIGLLRGLFDTDGHVETDSRKGLSIRLSSSDVDGVAAVQRILGRLGILSRIYLSRPAGYRSMPDGKGGSKEYWTKSSYRLCITSQYALRFMNLVGFYNGGKRDKFDTFMSVGRRWNFKPMWAVIESIEPGETIQVFDCTLPGLIYDGNGIDVYDCGEMPLESWESCNLGHINLARGTDADHQRSFRLMARFLLRATFCDIQDSKQREVVGRNRRIGVGFFGLQEWLGIRGIPYSQFERHGILADNLTLWYNIVREEADRYADKLGINRPIKCTTIAPTGTIAKLAGTSEGMQPIYAKYYLRRVRYSENDPELENLKALGVPLEPCVYNAGTLVASFPCEDPIMQKVHPSLVEEQHEISAETALAIQAYIQRYYVDNAISLTINVPTNNGRTAKEKLFTSIKKYLPHIKGVTVFPEASRPQSPIERITKDEYDTMVHTQSINAGTSDILLEECAGGACPIR